LPRCEEAFANGRRTRQKPFLTSTHVGRGTKPLRDAVSSHPARQQRTLRRAIKKTIIIPRQKKEEKKKEKEKQKGRQIGSACCAMEPLYLLSLPSPSATHVEGGQWVGRIAI